MINPLNFCLDEFKSRLGDQEIRSLEMENLKGSELIDNLILLKFLEFKDLQNHMKDTYDMDLRWLDADPTPKELKNLAGIYEVFFEKDSPQLINVYIPLGSSLDEATLQVDIPNYKFTYIFLPDCNYKSIKHNIDISVLNNGILYFRPALIMRRLVLDCLYNGGTDIHFQSVYVNKEPHHSIRYRIKRELYDSSFKLDRDLMKMVLQTTVAKLSSASASDLDSSYGVTTDIANLFGDGKCDLRMTGMQVSAGMYVVVAIQTTTTTLLTIKELGFPKSDVALIKDIARRRTGLTLVTGEMRSGKNTTIFAMLNEIVDLPIRIIEYSNPVENRMSFPQANYKGDIELLKSWLRLAKKQDIDIAVINEIPNSEVAFAVRDLVNSAIGVITTTHVDRVWHVCNKLSEFFGDDYKSIISQLNAVINQKMFRRWYGPNMRRYAFVPSDSEFDKFAYKCGVRYYYKPDDVSKVKYGLQPLTEIMVFTEDIKSALLNFNEMWRAEELLRKDIRDRRGTIEIKLAQYINAGICSLDELRKIF